MLTCYIWYMRPVLTLSMIRFGTYSTSEAINAGLDLEMPGPPRWRGSVLSHALLAKKVHPHILDDRVREVLKFVKKAIATGITENAEEKTGDYPETANLLRTIAADSIVLMKNERDILPLSKEKSVSNPPAWSTPMVNRLTNVLG